MRKKIDYDILEDTSFEYVNERAEVVIVGITPGNSQINKSEGLVDSKEYKRAYAFSGTTMRKNIIAMLDFIHVNDLLGIETCKSLWADDFDEVEMTSLLKRPTYMVSEGGENDKKEMFNDVSRIFENDKLKEEFERGFKYDCSLYSNAKLYVACGKGVYEVLQQLQSDGTISRYAKVVAIAHPSGQNCGGVGCYLGKEDNAYIWGIRSSKEAKAVVSELCGTVNG